MENISSFTFWKGDFTEEAIQKMKDIFWFPKDDGSVRVIDNNDDFIRVSITELQYRWIMTNLSGNKTPERPSNKIDEEVEKPKRKRKKEVIVEEVEPEHAQELKPEQEEQPVELVEEVAIEEPEVIEVEEVKYIAEELSKDELIEKCLQLLEEHDKEEVEVPVQHTFMQGTCGVIAAIIKAKKTKGGLFLTLEAQKGSPDNYVGKSTTCNAKNVLISQEAMKVLCEQMDSVLGLPFE